MKPTRLREIAAMLLKDAENYKHTALQAVINPEYAKYPLADRGKISREYTEEANKRIAAAKELQEFSFTHKG